MNQPRITTKLPPVVVGSRVTVFGIKRPPDVDMELIGVVLTVMDDPNTGISRDLEEILFQVPDAVSFAQELQMRAIQANQISAAKNQTP